MKRFEGLKWVRCESSAAPVLLQCDSSESVEEDWGHSGATLEEEWRLDLPAQNPSIVKSHWTKC